MVHNDFKIILYYVCTVLSNWLLITIYNFELLKIVQCIYIFVKYKLGFKNNAIF